VPIFWLSPGLASNVRYVDFHSPIKIHSQQVYGLLAGPANSRPDPQYTVAPTVHQENILTNAYKLWSGGEYTIHAMVDPSYRILRLSQTRPKMSTRLLVISNAIAVMSCRGYVLAGIIVLLAKSTIVLANECVFIFRVHEIVAISLGP